jgi:molecular chaperone GrpE
MSDAGDDTVSQETVTQETEETVPQEHQRDDVDDAPADDTGGAPADDTGDATVDGGLDDFTGQFVRPDEQDLDEIGDVLEHDLEQLLAERDSFKDIAQRLQADFDNYRKRAAVQSADEVDRATGRLAEAFLPVLDAAEAAYLRHPDEVGPLLNVLLGELKKHGLETLDLDGQPFDPEVAEAVAHEPDEDGGQVVVAEVLRSGYRWRGRTLRPAMVRTRG